MKIKFHTMARPLCVFIYTCKTHTDRRKFEIIFAIYRQTQTYLSTCLYTQLLMQGVPELNVKPTRGDSIGLNCTEKKK